MKKQILSYVVVILSGVFFAGFGGTVAAQGEAEFYQSLVKSRCLAMKNKVDDFEEKKIENNFDYTKFSYEKEAYEKELEAYISLENSLSCLDKNIDCRKSFKTIDKIKPTETCFNGKKEEITDTLDKLKLASTQFEESAKLLEQAEELYFGERHLRLDKEKTKEDGKRDSERSLDSIMTDNVITKAGGGFLYSTQETLHNIFRGSIIKTTNRVLGTVSILYLFILGVKFIMARGDSERLSALKGQFAWIILGLAVISLAEFIGYEVFDPSSGKDVLEGISTRNFRDKVMDIVRFFEYIAGGLMLINAVISAYGLIIGGEEDEAISKEKQFLKSFLLGTAFILLAEVIVRILSFQEGVNVSTGIAVKEIAGVVNFSLSFMGIVAVAMVVMAGMYYVISFGDEEQMGRAKKMIINSVVGVIIAFSAYTIVRFLIV